MLALGAAVGRSQSTLSHYLTALGRQWTTMVLKLCEVIAILLSLNPPLSKPDSLLFVQTSIIKGNILDSRWVM
jgi:hypothetical protein